MTTDADSYRERFEAFHRARHRASVAPSTNPRWAQAAIAGHRARALCGR